MEAVNGSNCLSCWAGVNVEEGVVVDDEDVNSSCIKFPCGLGNTSCLRLVSHTDRYLPIYLFGVPMG